jgi:hypothetical protein
MAVRLTALSACRPLTPGWFLVLISVRGWVDPMAGKIMPIGKKHGRMWWRRDYIKMKIGDVSRAELCTRFTNTSVESGQLLTESVSIRLGWTRCGCLARIPTLRVAFKSRTHKLLSSAQSSNFCFEVQVTLWVSRPAVLMIQMFLNTFRMFCIVGPNFK